MIPATSLSAGNYTITQEGGEEVAVKSAAFDPENGSVTLTTQQALKPDTTYTITTRNLTDLANHPLVETTASLRTWDDDPKGIKVFILAGQSNMVGYGHTEEGQNNEVGGAGTLRYLAVHDSEYPEFDYSSLLVDPKQPATSAWKTRSNVKLWWRNGANAQYGGQVFKGDLGPLTSNGRWFGPEFGFGQVIGDYYKNDDVLIIKPAWGGHNLVSHFRSPSAVAKRGGAIGPSYIEIFDNAREVLFNLGKEFPEWKGRGYQIVGFAWHQGTSDKAPDKVAEEYKDNLPDFISDVRSEFGKPELPFVIATTGMGYGGGTSPPPYESYHAGGEGPALGRGCRKARQRSDRRHPRIFRADPKTPRETRASTGTATPAAISASARGSATTWSTFCLDDEPDEDDRTQSNDCSDGHVLLTAVFCRAGEPSRLVTNLEAGQKQVVVAYGTSLTAGGAWVEQMTDAMDKRYPGIWQPSSTAEGQANGRNGVSEISTKR